MRTWVSLVGSRRYLSGRVKHFLSRIRLRTLPYKKSLNTFYGAALDAEFKGAGLFIACYIVYH